MKNILFCSFLLLLVLGAKGQTFYVTNSNADGEGSLYKALRDSYSDEDIQDDKIEFQLGTGEITIISRSINFFPLRKDTFPNAAQDRLLLEGAPNLHVGLSYSVLCDLHIHNLHLLDNVTFGKEVTVTNSRIEKGCSLGFPLEEYHAVTKNYVFRNNEFLSGNIYAYGHSNTIVIAQNYFGYTKTLEKGSGALVDFSSYPLNDVRVDSNSFVLASSVRIGNDLTNARITQNKFGWGDELGSAEWTISSYPAISGYGNANTALIIRNNTILHSGTSGIDLNGVGSSDISDNYIGTTSTGISGTVTSSGISLSTCDNPTVQNNVIRNCNWGISTSYSTHLLLQNNEVGSCTTGFYIGSSSGILNGCYSGTNSAGNNIGNKEYGYHLDRSTVEVKNCKSSYNKVGLYGTGSYKLSNVVMQNSTDKNYNSQSAFDDLEIKRWENQTLYGTSQAGDSVEIYASLLVPTAFSNSRGYLPTARSLGKTLVDNAGNWTLFIPNDFYQSAEELYFVGISTDNTTLTSSQYSNHFVLNKQGVYHITNANFEGPGSFNWTQIAALGHPGDAKMKFKIKLDSVGSQAYVFPINTNSINQRKNNGVITIEGNDIIKDSIRLSCNNTYNVENTIFTHIGFNLGSSSAILVSSGNTTFETCYGGLSIQLEGSVLRVKNSNFQNADIVTSYLNPLIRDVQIINSKFPSSNHKFHDILDFTNVHDVIIKKCFFGDNLGYTNAIDLKKCSDILFDSNTFNTPATGRIILSNNRNIHFSNNNFPAPGFGGTGGNGKITVYQDTLFTFSNNVVRDQDSLSVTASPSFCFLSLTNVKGASIQKNIFKHTVSALALTGSTEVDFSGNQVNFDEQQRPTKFGVPILNYSTQLIETDAKASFKDNAFFIDKNLAKNNLLKCNNCPIARNRFINELAEVTTLADSLVTDIRSSYAKPIFLNYSKIASSFTLQGSSQNGDTVEIFTNNNLRENAVEYIGSVVTSNGTWSFPLPAAYFNPSKSAYFTATAKNTQGNTSGLTPQFRIEATSCEVTNTGNAGVGSLRNAIDCANQSPIGAAIIFQIPGTGPHVIQPLTNLPALNSNIVLDGFTQAGDGVYDIVLDGSVVDTLGLRVGFGTKHTTVKGIFFQNFKDGILVTGGSDSNTVLANKFSTISRNAISLNGLCDGNIVEGNEIQNVAGTGISINGACNENIVRDNKITQALLGIQLNGGCNNNQLVFNKITHTDSNSVEIQSGSNQNVVRKNTIGESKAQGISVFFSSTDTKIIENYIGVDSLYTHLPNTKNGIYLANGTNRTRLSGNVIGNSGGEGIYITSQNDTLKGNYIGVGKNLEKIPNTKNGVYVDYQGGGTAIIGGNPPSDPNTFGNNLNGIYVTQYATGNTFLKNVFLENAQKAINLYFYQEGSTSGNNSKKVPVITKATKTANGYTFKMYTQTKDKNLEVFKSDYSGQTATVFLPSAYVATTIDSTEWQVNVTTTETIPYFSVTTSDRLGNTSELGSTQEACLTVTNTYNDGPGSLRAAMGCANAAPDTSLIVFAIADTSKTIRPLTSLPNIYYPTIFNASSKEIVLDGQISSGNGLNFSNLYNKSAGHVIRLTVKNFINGLYGYCYGGFRADSLRAISNKGIGIAISSDSIWISKSIIAYNTAQGVFQPNSTGAKNLTVKNSIVSYNGSDGIAVFQGPGYVRIDSSNILNNGANGVYFNFGVQGDSYIKNNIISGNVGHGIRFDRTQSNLIKDNIIGLREDTITSNPNGKSGIYIAFSAISRIDHNVISTNGEYGIYFAQRSTDTIIANYLGTNSKWASLGNKQGGIFVSGDSRPIIGKKNQPNYICFNNGHGIEATSTASLEINYNFIGLTREFEPAGNQKSGILSGYSHISNNYIGFNKKHGIETRSSFIKDNYIGTNEAGLDLGNDSTGIKMSDSNMGDSLSKNIVAFNQIGIDLTNNAKVFECQLFSNDSSALLIRGTRNILSKNTFTKTKSGLKAIHLVQTSPTLIGNNNKAKPSISNFVLNNNLLSLSGSSQKNDSVEVFLNDSSNAQTALQYLGHVKTDAQGKWSLDVPNQSLNVNKGLFLVATATDSANNTSELSIPFKIKLYDGNCLVKNTKDEGEGSLREAIHCANYSIKKAIISFAIDGAGPHLIETTNSLSGLKNIFGDSVVIDGFSQQNHPNGTGDPSISLKTNSWNDGKIRDTFSLHLVRVEGMLFDSTTVISDGSILNQCTFKNNEQGVFVSNSTIAHSIFENVKNCVATQTIGGTNLITNTLFKNYLQGINGQVSFVVLKSNQFFGEDSASKDVSLSYLGGAKGLFEDNYFTSGVSVSGGDGTRLTMKNNHLGIRPDGSKPSRPISGIYFTGNYLKLQSNVIGNCETDAITVQSSDTLTIAKNLIGLSDTKKPIPVQGNGILVNVSNGQNFIDSNFIYNTTKNGIYIQNSRGIHIRHNTIGNSDNSVHGVGIALNNSQDPVLQHNQIAYCDSNGLEIQFSPTAQVEQNKISHIQQDGVVLRSCAQPTLLGNEIIKTRFGVTAVSTTRALAQNNQIDSSQIGFYLTSDNASTYTLNRLANNGQGFVLTYSNTDSLTHNHIAGSVYGGVLLAKGNNQGFISANTLVDNDLYAIKIDSSSNDTRIHANSIKASDTTFGNAIDYQNSSNGLMLSNTLQGYSESSVSIHKGQAKISRTSIDHSTKAIDLHLLSPSTGNNSKIKPTLTGIIRRGDKLLLRLKSEKGDSVEVFTSTTQGQHLITYSGTYFIPDISETEVELPSSLLNIKDTLVVRATATAGYNTSEVSDFIWTCPSCICLVTTIEDNVPNSFRRAIQKANEGTCGTIAFKISTGNTADTLVIQSELPEILNTVFIDGSTESGYSSNTDPVVWLSDQHHQWSQGLLLNSYGSTVKGIGISGFQQGILMTGEANRLSHVTIGKTQTQFISIQSNGNQVDSCRLGVTFDSKSLSNSLGAGVVIDGTSNTLRSTKIAHTQQENLLIQSGSGNTFLGGALYASGTTDYTKRIGIKLEPTTNDGIDKPNFTTHALTGNSIQLNGTAEAGAKIQIYKSNGIREQALFYLGEVIANGGNWTFLTSDYLADQANAYIATATNANGSTSQLSNVYRVGVFVEVCPVTNIGNAGEGTFREAVNCANNSDLKAIIDFQLESGPQEIHLTSSDAMTLFNTQGVEIDASSKNIMIISDVPSNIFHFNTSKTRVEGLLFRNLGIEVRDGQQNIFRNNSFEGLGLTLLENSDGNIVDSNTFAKTSLKVGMGTTPDLCLCASGNILSNNVIGMHVGGVPSPVDSFGIVVLSKEGNNQIHHNTIGNIRKSGLAAFGIVSVQPNGEITNNQLGKVNNFDAPIAGYGIFAAGKASQIYQNTIQLADTGIVTATQWLGLPLTQLFPGLAFDDITIQENTVDRGNGAGIVIDGVQQALLTKNLIKEPGTGKGILLKHNGNGQYKSPSIYKYTVYENQLHVFGKSTPNDHIELFNSTSQGQRSIEFLTSFIVDGSGEWKTVLSLDQLNKRGDNYFVATARNPNKNTSEFSDLFNANLKVCLVTKTENDGPNTLRFAIDSANLGQCNLIQFNLPTSATGTLPIQLQATLPSLHASNVIVDGTSQPSYLPNRQAVVLVTSVNRLPHGLVSTGNQNFSMHGMAFDNFDASVKLENSPNAYLRRNKISGTDLAISIDALSGTNTWVEENEVNGKETGHEVKKGILSDGPKSRVNGNVLTNVQSTGIQTKADSVYVLNNTFLNVPNSSAPSSTDASILLLNSSKVIVQGNTLYSCARGIVLSETYDSYIGYNTLQTNKGDSSTIRLQGIALLNSSSNFIESNTISDSLTNGIALSESKDNWVQNNKVSRCDKGIWLENGRHNNVKANRITQGAYGIWQETSSRADSFLANNIYSNRETAIVLKGNANLVFSNFLGNSSADRVLNNSLGMLVESDSNQIGNKQTPNLVLNNRFGGITVIGHHNKIVYNQLIHNDTSETQPLSLAIDLKNKTGNESINAPHIDTYKRLTDTTFNIIGSAVAGDSIHLYNTFGFPQETRKCVGTGITENNGKWTIKLEAEFVEKFRTTYLVATATNNRLNTSQLSNMIPVGNCYITETRDNGNSLYPISGSVRAAIGCANMVPERAKILNAINGANNAVLIDTLPYLVNPLGLEWSGQNIRAHRLRLAITAEPTFNTHPTSAIRIGAISEKVVFNNMTLNGFDTAAVLHHKTVEVDSITATGCLGDTCLGKTAFVLGPLSETSRFQHIQLNKFQNAIERPTLIDSVLVSNSLFNGVRRLFPSQDIVQNSSINNVTWINFESILEAKQIQNVQMLNDTFVSSQSEMYSPTLSLLIQAENVHKFSLQNSSVNLKKGGYKNEGDKEFISIQHGDTVHLTGNTFQADSAFTFVRIGSDSTHSYGNSLGNNTIQNLGIGIKLAGTDVELRKNTVIARYHAVYTNQLTNSTFASNTFVSTDSSIVRLVQSSQLRLTQNAIFGDTSGAKAINLNLADDGNYSNHRRYTPQILGDGKEMFKGKPRRVLRGTALPNDHLEIFFSDSANANAREYIADTIMVDAAGNWSYVMPREWNLEHKNAKFLTVTATDSNFNTSEFSNVYRLDTLLNLIYVLNTNNVGVNSLRWAIDQVNATDFYTKVIFKIPGEGPHVIAVKDSALPTLYNYSGFVMDGGSQKDSANEDLRDKDQQVYIDGQEVDSSYAFHVLSEVGKDSRINELTFVNFEKGIKLQSESVVLDSLYIYSKNALNKDTAIYADDASNSASAFSIRNCDIVGYHTGIWLAPSTKKATLDGNRMDSVKLGIVLTNGVTQCQVRFNDFVNVDSTAILMQNAGVENLIRQNWFGYDTTQRNQVHTFNNGLWMQNTSMSIIDSNRFILTTASDTSLQNGISLLLTKGSSSNNISNNYFGYHPSLSVTSPLPVDTTHALVLQGEANVLLTDNRITGNKFGNLRGIGITMTNTSDNMLAGNYFGISPNKKDTLNMDSTAIGITNGLRDQIIGNTVANYRGTAIDLNVSKQITMFKNELFSSSDTSMAIRLNNNSNNLVQPPSVQKWDIIDTSTIRISGSSLYTNGIIEVFVGDSTFKQALTYIDRVDLNGKDWSLLVKKPFFTLDKQQYFVATYTDAYGNTSEIGNSFTTQGFLCKLDSLVLPKEILTCPGVVTVLNAGIPNMHYKWSALNNSTYVVSPDSQKISIKEADTYHVEVRDDFGCFKEKDVKLTLYERAYEPDFIISKQVFTNDTIAIVDISTIPLSDPSLSITWDYGGAFYLKTLSENDNDPRVRYVLFPDSNVYTISATSTLDKCETVVSKTVTAVPIGTIDPKGPRIVLPSEIKMNKVTVFPVPLYDCCFNVDLEINDTVEVEIYLSRLDGADIQKYVIPKTELYEYNNTFKLTTSFDVSTLPSGVYFIRILAGADKKVVKVEIIK